MKMSITKNRNLIRYVHYGIALVIVLICTMTACKKKEHAPLTHQQSTGSSNRLTITGFSPTYGIEGITHTITITGTNFSNTAADNIISTGITLPGIGPIVIHTTHASPTSLKADVYLPPGSGGNSATLSISVKGKPDV